MVLIMKIWCLPECDVLWFGREGSSLPQRVGTYLSEYLVSHLGDSSLYSHHYENHIFQILKEL